MWAGVYTWKLFSLFLSPPNTLHSPPLSLSHRARAIMLLQPCELKGARLSAEVTVCCVDLSVMLGRAIEREAAPHPAPQRYNPAPSRRTREHADALVTACCMLALQAPTPGPTLRLVSRTQNKWVSAKSMHMRVAVCTCLHRCWLIDKRAVAGWKPPEGSKVAAAVCGVGSGAAGRRGRGQRGRGRWRWRRWAKGRGATENGAGQRREWRRRAPAVPVAVLQQL